MSRPQKTANKVRLDNPTRLLPTLGHDNCSYRECYIEKVKYILPLIDVNPYVQWISGNMFLYPPFKSYLSPHEQKTNGRWKSSNDPRINRSTCQLAMISRPTNDQLQDQYNKFGYHMEWPPPLVGRWLPNSMKYFTKMKEKGEYADVVFLPAVGIVDDKTGKYLSEYGQAIAGYFIMKDDPRVEEERVEFINSQPLWFRKQYLVGWANYFAHYARQIARGTKMVERSKGELPYHGIYTRSLPTIDEEMVADLPKGLMKTITESGAYKDEGEQNAV